MHAWGQLTDIIKASWLKWYKTKIIERVKSGKNRATNFEEWITFDGYCDIIRRVNETQSRKLKTKGIWKQKDWRNKQKYII